MLVRPLPSLFGGVRQSSDTARTVMSLAVTRDHRFAFTVAADHFICKYRVFDIVRRIPPLLRPM